MRDMFLHGSVIKMIGMLTGHDTENQPIVEGEALERIASALTTWENGPSFATDCKLGGIEVESTRHTIADLHEAASNKEKVHSKN
jgi:hypothetical protein